MTHLIKIAARKEFDSKSLWEMHRLRAKIFKEKKGWSIPVISGMEIDGYDALDPYYLLISEPSKGLCGCTRALPTDGPYMLKDTFPELLYGHPPPNSDKVWELSRLVVEADGEHKFGFSGVTLDAFREMVLFGDRMGIERYVIVTTPSVERLLRHAGFSMNRFGPPMRIGVEKAVALDIDIGEQTHEALFGKFQKAA
jgi:acyl homoserine lactone synthase